MWTPDAETEAFLRADWERVQSEGRHGLAHGLSESDGRIMGPCTKGPAGASLGPSPFPRSRALQGVRAEALRSPSASTGTPNGDATTSIAPTLRDVKGRRVRAAAPRTLRAVRRADRWRGRRMNSASRRRREEPRGAGLPTDLRRSRASRRRFPGVRGDGADPSDQRVGPEAPDALRGALLPRLRLLRLLEEEWENSDLLSRVEFMLLIPVLGPMKGTPSLRARSVARCFGARPPKSSS